VDLATYWTVRDTTAADCLELGPVLTREEAEAEARRHRFPFLVFHRDYRDDTHILVHAEHIIYRLYDVPLLVLQQRIFCRICGVECDEATPRSRENWRDFHEFENMGHQTVELRWTAQGWIPVRRSDSVQ